MRAAHRGMINSKLFYNFTMPVHLSCVQYPEVTHTTRPCVCSILHMHLARFIKGYTVYDRSLLSMSTVLNNSSSLWIKRYTNKFELKINYQIKRVMNTFIFFPKENLSFANIDSKILNFYNTLFFKNCTLHISMQFHFFHRAPTIP